MPDNIYLRAWWDEDKNGEFVRVLVTDKRAYLRGRIVWGGIQRGDQKCTVYCTHWNMDNPLTRQELRGVATKWLNGEYKTNEVNLGER